MVLCRRPEVHEKADAKRIKERDQVRNYVLRSCSTQTNKIQETSRIYWKIRKTHANNKIQNTHIACKGKSGIVWQNEEELRGLSGGGEELLGGGPVWL